MQSQNFQQQQGYPVEQDPSYGQYGGEDHMQTGAPVPKGSRPFVDPEAAGEVDPSQYPAPKESTDKIRGKSDIIEMFCNNVLQELLIAKTFYFFFFSAFGSLFPLMAVYFKQMGMNPCQTGVLIGVRPFVEFIAAPFWASIADKFQRGKVMLLGAVGAWIIFTLSLGFVEPPAIACVKYNGTAHILSNPSFENTKKRRSLDYTNEVNSPHSLPFWSHDFEDSKHDIVKRFASQSKYDDMAYEFPVVDYPALSGQLPYHRSKRDTPLPPNHVIGKSPNLVHYTVNFDEYAEADTWLSPPFSSIVYREADVQKVFFLLLLLVMLGEFFSCPAITLADSAVLNYLGEESSDHYGRQRMFGSLGWGLSMFFVGIALDHSTAFPGHACGPHEKERNYTICFAIFGVLMGCAFITATQFKFTYNEPSDSMGMDDLNKDPVDSGPRPWNEPKIPLQESKSRQQQIEEAIGKVKTKVFAQTMKEMPQWMVVLREFQSVRLVAFLVIAWWMGFGIGLIFSFLFWHLQDVGGTPTVFGIASIINHISEIFAYFFSFRLISQIGHVKVLCIGLLGNVLRFLYISWINNPWWVLPFEFIQGITHAAVWAACCSYIAHNCKPELRAQSQGVLQGIHHGFGRGSGAIIGGLFVKFFGTATVFRIYGILSFFILGIFVFVNFYQKDQGFQSELPPELDPRNVAEETTALAPHGVPANPMHRAVSSQKLNEPQPDGASYGTYTNNGMLDVGAQPPPNPTNPFAQGNFSDGSNPNEFQQQY